MSFFSQFVAIWNNAARSIRRHGFVRGFSYYLYTVLVRKCPFGRDRLVSLKVPRTHDVVKARLGTHDAAAFRQIFLTGDYDFPLTEEPRVVVDAGAHVGYGATFFTLKPEQHDYQLYLAINDNDHTKTTAKSPQTNAIYERFDKAVLDEFYRVAFRNRIYEDLEAVQCDVDDWICYYNNERTHQCKMC